MKKPSSLSSSFLPPFHIPSVWWYLRLPYHTIFGGVSGSQPWQRSSSSPWTGSVIDSGAGAAKTTKCGIVWRAPVLTFLAIRWRLPATLGWSTLRPSPTLAGISPVERIFDHFWCNLKVIVICVWTFHVYLETKNPLAESGSLSTSYLSRWISSLLAHNASTTVKTCVIFQDLAWPSALKARCFLSLLLNCVQNVSLTSASSVLTFFFWIRGSNEDTTWSVPRDTKHPSKASTQRGTTSSMCPRTSCTPASPWGCYPADQPPKQSDGQDVFSFFLLIFETFRPMSSGYNPPLLAPYQP